MSERRYVLLDGRGLLRVSGEDARKFLQGMITNDVTKATPRRAIYAAFLTPQGKFLADFFIAEGAGALLLDCEAARLPELMKRLTVYKLRAKVSLEDVSANYRVAALIGPGAIEAAGLAPECGAARQWQDGALYADPRLVALGARALLPHGRAGALLEGLGFAAGRAEDYERLRLSLGVPDGSRDMAVEKAILLENGFEALNGVDFDKGCFVGQELTARTKYRGLVKKHLFKVEVEGPLPAAGTPITLGGREAGEMRSGFDGMGLALLRFEQVREAEAKGAPLEAGDARLRPLKPDWARFDLSSA